MKRQIDQDWITPDKLHTSRDLVPLGCNHCANCSYCCKNWGCDILLDPYDMKLLKEATGMGIDALLLNKLIRLSAVDGIIQPGLARKPETDECVFLDDQGRCTIHSARPGVCRLFPLGRLYHEDGSFSYFLQPGECVQPDGVKIRISKWLEYPDIKTYEAFVRSYHAALMELKKQCEGLKIQKSSALQTEFLEKWFFQDP